MRVFALRAPSQWWKSSARGRPRAAFTAACRASSSPSSPSPAPAPGPVDAAAGEEEEARVCIVGAGPVGLCLSLLLAQHGVQSTILERRVFAASPDAGPSESASLDSSGSFGFSAASAASSAASSAAASAAASSAAASAAASSASFAAPPHPRAHVLNARTMEIFRAMGLEAAVRALAPPAKQWSDFRYSHSLVGGSNGDFAVDRHLSASRPRARNLSRHTPSFITHVSQPRLEALLLDKVREHADMIDLRFGVDVRDVRFPADGDGDARARSHHENGHEKSLPPAAKIIFQERHSSSPSHLSSRFICAADGAASPVRRAAGVSLQGEKALEKFASVHFTSRQLSPMVNPGVRGAMLYFVMNPSVIACVVAHDIGAGSWVAQIPVFPPHAASTGDESDPAWRKYCEEAIDACVGLPGLDRTIHSSRVWSMDMLCADTFSVEQERSWVFLVGDSAHQLPPSGGFGLNTGIQDAHNLAWKLAKAAQAATPDGTELDEAEEDALLHSYTHERRPIALDNLAVSKDNYLRGLSAPKAIGLNRELIAFASKALDNPIASALLPSSLRAQLLETGASAGRMALLSAPTRDFASRRIEEVVRSGEALPLLFPAHDIGYTYGAGGATRKEGGRARFQEPMALYTPSVETGSRFPHVWLREKSGSGEVISSLDLVDARGGHVLFVTEQADGLMASSSEEDEGVSVVVRTQDFEVVPMVEAIVEFGKCHGHAAFAGGDTAVWAEEEERQEDYEAEAAWASLWGATSGRLWVRPDGHIA